MLAYEGIEAGIDYGVGRRRQRQLRTVLRRARIGLREHFPASIARAHTFAITSAAIEQIDIRSSRAGRRVDALAHERRAVGTAVDHQAVLDTAIAVEPMCLAVQRPAVVDCVGVALVVLAGDAAGGKADRGQCGDVAVIVLHTHNSTSGDSHRMQPTAARQRSGVASGQASNGWRSTMVWSRSGPVEIRSSGTPTSASMRSR